MINDIKNRKQNLRNRELSWLMFNARVMQEAMDVSVPLLQRLRFLGIFSNNLDEFFKVRVASLRREMVALSRKKSKSDELLAGGYTPEELFVEIQNNIKSMQQTFDVTYRQIISEMKAANINVVREHELSFEQQNYVRSYFKSKVLPQIVPLIIRRRGKEFPSLADDRIYMVVKLHHGAKRNTVAIIEMPVNSDIPRFLALPEDKGSTKKCIMFLDDVIRLCVDEIFFMFNFDMVEAYAFKFTRDAEITLDDDISKSTIEKMENSLEQRIVGRPVRFVYDKNMPDDLLELLTSKLGIRMSDSITPGGRYHQMRDLIKFPKINAALEYKLPEVVGYPDVAPRSSLMDVIKHRDLMLNFPYHSFGCLVDFLREAAIDPKVEEIYVTLYRVAENSRIINALINAAKNGKRVVVLVELLARFDEERNIYWSDVLQRSGIRVINGVEGLKVHSKLILVRKREKGQLVGYTYVGTGNLNESTASIYTDLGLFTYHQGIANDAMKVFEFLEKNHRRFDCKHLVVSPYQMRRAFAKHIKQETVNAANGKRAYIYLKVNSLVDEDMIDLLYKASQAGVDVRLIVRSACCLRPKVEGLSDRIRAISIVDAYLEHERFVIFCNDGQDLTYIMSADWMVRNFDRRVEVAAPIYDPRLKKMVKDIFMIQWQDNTKARDLSSGSLNEYVRNNLPAVRSQFALFDYYANLYDESQTKNMDRVK